MANRNYEPCLQQLSILRIFVFVVLALIIIPFARSYTIIQSSDGEDVYCVDKMTQPAFGHPLLKDHKFQEQPSEIPTEIEPFQQSTRQTFEAHISTANCPEGTVPIRPPADPHNQTRLVDTLDNHEYAKMSIGDSPTSKLYGTKATINVWDPTLEIQEKEISISQIWIASGQRKTGDLNTIEVGWQVYPWMYKDSKPRLFLFWTVYTFQGDVHKTTGCYNLQCPGFIQTSNNIVIGGAINPISSYGGSQFEITIHVWKDTKSGNWWLSLGSNNLLVGYWPNEIFTTLADHAENVQWGGEIVNSKTFGRHTKTQMGSGHFPNEGFMNASYFRNLMIVDNNNSLQSLRGLKRIETNPKYYSVKDQYTEDWKTHFFYGGPGFTGGSEATHLTLGLTSFCFLFSIFSII